MVAVTNSLRLPNGEAPDELRVKVRLIASDHRDTSSGWRTSDGREIAGEHETTTANGDWTLDLEPNANVEPAGTWYEVWQWVDGQRIVPVAITVPTGAGPHKLHDLLATPAALGSLYASVAALTAHVSDPSAAHAASAVSFAPFPGLASTTVQAAVADLFAATVAAVNGLVALAGSNVVPAPGGSLVVEGNYDRDRGRNFLTLPFDAGIRGKSRSGAESFHLLRVANEAAIDGGWGDWAALGDNRLDWLSCLCDLDLVQNSIVDVRWVGNRVANTKTRLIQGMPAAAGGTAYDVGIATHNELATSYPNDTNDLIDRLVVNNGVTNANTIVEVKNSRMLVTGPADAVVPLTVVGTAAQSANVVQWKKGNTVVGAIRHDGLILAPNISNLADSGPYIDFSPGAITLANRISISNVLLLLSGMAGQTGNYLQVTASTGAILSRFNGDGYFMTRKVAAPADAALVASEMALWLDATNGAAKLMVKAKQADGTVRTGSLALA